MTRTPITLLALSLVLTGCGGAAEKKQQGAGKVGGEVLPGSASDAMLPYDTVKSQAPLAPKAKESTAGKREVGSTDQGDNTDSSRPD